jgi:hypothetical protein
MYKVRKRRRFIIDPESDLESDAGDNVTPFHGLAGGAADEVSVKIFM